MVQIKQVRCFWDSCRKIIFISHMVQIKRFCCVWCVDGVIRLYIPYGSDKTYNKVSAFVLTDNFISHMVQIKLFSCVLCWCGGLLYIPYGSDKTFPGPFGRDRVFLLYIPYGSDKTLWYLFCLSSAPSFISHMVQIKRPALISSIHQIHPLYPIWFR